MTASALYLLLPPFFLSIFRTKQHAFKLCFVQRRVFKPLVCCLVRTSLWSDSNVFLRSRELRWPERSTIQLQPPALFVSGAQHSRVSKLWSFLSLSPCLAALLLTPSATRVPFANSNHFGSRQKLTWRKSRPAPVDRLRFEEILRLSISHVIQVRDLHGPRSHASLVFHLQVFLFLFFFRTDSVLHLRA